MKRASTYKTYRTYKVGTRTVPGHIQTEILLRFLSVAEMSSLMDSYDAAKLKLQGARTPTETERAVAAYHAKHQNLEMAAKKFSITKKKVSYIFRKVAVYDFINK